MTIVVLDSGILGLICHVSRKPSIIAAQDWLSHLRDSGVDIALPEIADYEVRRELIRINSAPSLSTLDRLSVELRYLPITTREIRQAAELWAETRRVGRVTAPEPALDGDVILAAQALSLGRSGVDVIVATTNTRHLSWFVDAREWTEVTF